MSAEHTVSLDFLAAPLHRVLSELHILRDDVDVVAATTRRIDGSFDRLETGLRSELRELRDEMREIRSELRAMHARQQRTIARVRALEEPGDRALTGCRSGTRRRPYKA